MVSTSLLHHLHIYSYWEFRFLLKSRNAMWHGSIYSHGLGQGSTLLHIFDFEQVLWSRFNWDWSQWSTTDWPCIANQFWSPANAIVRIELRDASFGSQTLQATSFKICSSRAGNKNLNLTFDYENPSKNFFATFDVSRCDHDWGFSVGHI